MKTKTVLKEGKRLGVWKSIRDDRQKAREIFNLLKKRVNDLKDEKSGAESVVVSSSERPSKISQHHSGAFIEFPVLCKQTEDRPFFFVLTPTDMFEGKKANSASFDRVFRQNASAKTVLAFQNISGDGNLIAPVPLEKSYADCGHVMDYLLSENEPVDRKVDLLQEVAKSALSMYETSDRVYVSTSGLGVPWLHFRVFPSPKYYVWKEYDDDKPLGGAAAAPGNAEKKKK